MEDTLGEHPSHQVKGFDFQRQLASRGDDRAEVTIRVAKHLDNNAPRTFFGATALSCGTSSQADSPSQRLETDPTTISAMDQDSFAFEGQSIAKPHQPSQPHDSANSTSSLDVELSECPLPETFRIATVKELAQHIESDSDEELGRRAEEAEAIIQGAGRAFGEDCDDQSPEDSRPWCFAASNGDEAVATIEGLRRKEGQDNLAS